MIITHGNCNVGKKIYLKNLSADPSIQQKLLQLLSMFEVSFTVRQRKNYLLYCLLYLFDQYDGDRYDEEILSDYAKFVEELADKYLHDVYLISDKLNNINTPKPGSFDESVLKYNKLNVANLLFSFLYFIETGNYKTIFDVNKVLYQFDQQLLGV